MSFIDRGDDEFERALRHSARRDAPAADATARAWSRFAVRLAASPVHESPGPVRAPLSVASPVRRFRNALATAKWVVLGAIGGSAVTFALVGRHAGPPARVASPGPPSSLRDPSANAAGQAAPSPRDALEPQPGAGSASVSSVLPSPGPALARVAPPLPNVPRRGVAAPEASTLAAEVAALDAARGALDAGAPDDARTLLHRYLLDFPKGKLVPEAEVLAIEACAEKGDRLRVTREAARFLERYPNAPQRTRVQQLRRDASPSRSPASP